MARKIVVVEDNPITRKMLVFVLETAGYVVFGAADGETALEWIAAESPCLVVVDLLLPNMDGVTLAKKVRALPGGGDIVLIALSGLATKLEEARALTPGFDHLLYKPIEPSKLIKLVQLIESQLEGSDTATEQQPTPFQTSTARADVRNGDDCARRVLQLERRAMLADHLAHEVAAKTAQLSIVTAVADVVAHSLDLEPVLQEVLARTLDAAGVSIGAIYVADPDGSLRLACQVGFPRSQWDHLTTLFGRPELLTQVLVDTKPMRVPTSGTGGPTIGLDAEKELSLCMLFPLIAGGERLGVLLIASAQRHLGDDWTQIGPVIGMQIAQAVALARTLARLRTSEQRYRTWFEGMPIGLYRTTPGGEILDANAAMVELLGYPSRDALRTVNIRSAYVTPEDRERWQALLERTGSVRHFEVRHRRPDGTVIWVRDNAHATRDGNGRIKWYEGSLEDITAQRQASDKLQQTEEERRQNAELLLSVVHGTSDAIYVKDLDGRYLLMNTAAAAMSSMVPEQIIGRTDVDLFGHEGSRMIRETDRAILSTGQTETAEEVLKIADGRVVTFLSTTGVFRDRLGKVAGIIGISKDMTRYRELEARLQQSQKMEAIGRLAGGIAHDFNNLLSAIMSYADLLQEDLARGDPRREDAVEISRAAVRAAGLTHQLLAFSRQQVLAPRVVNLNQVVMAVDNMLRRIIGEDIDLEPRLDPDLGSIMADPGQLEQVVMNLAVNARDAMPNGGKLTLETANIDLDEDYAAAHAVVAAGRYVMLAVSDTGCGMDEATKARVFEPFFTTKENGKGTGLGLATVYGIVHQSGGHVWLYSELGRGTTFKIYLPRVDVTEIAQSVTPIQTAGRSRGNETILFIEDDDVLRKVGNEILVRQGYTVLVANGGTEALAICQQHQGPIGLIAADVVMPGLNGADVVAQCLPLHPAAKVLFMSGYTDDAIVRHGVLESGRAFLQKPFSASTLARKVRDVLDGPSPMVPSRA